MCLCALRWSAKGKVCVACVLKGRCACEYVALDIQLEREREIVTVLVDVCVLRV